MMPVVQSQVFLDVASLTEAMVHSEALDLLSRLPDESIDLIYVDPPFNTQQERKGGRLTVRKDAEGDRIGFSGERYRSEHVAGPSFADSFDDYISWLRPHIEESKRVLKNTGSIYLHVDPHESHYCKVLLDQIFGRNHFLNEIIWAYDFGGRSNKKWPTKHDVILLYVKDPANYYFDTEEIDRMPYMSPTLVTAEKRERGKLPTDVWWQTIVPTNSKDRTGYPTQKPVELPKRAIAASCPKDGVVLDWCAGSGTTGAAARELGRRFLLGDNSEDAVNTACTRLSLLRQNLP